MQLASLCKINTRIADTAKLKGHGQDGYVVE